MKDPFATFTIGDCTAKTDVAEGNLYVKFRSRKESSLEKRSQTNI